MIWRASGSISTPTLPQTPQNPARCNPSTAPPRPVLGPLFRGAACTPFGWLYSVTGGFWPLTLLVAAPDFLSRPDSTRVTKVLLATLLANDTDLEGGTVGITAVGDALPAGATVAISCAFAVYVVPSDAAGDGGFTYTLSNGISSVTGAVTVTETSSSGAAGSPNSASLTAVRGDYALKFQGVPGRNYGVQYTTNVSPPYVWREFLPPVSLLAPAGGVLTHTDVDPPDPIRLYRAMLLP